MPKHKLPGNPKLHEHAANTVQLHGRRIDAPTRPSNIEGIGVVA